MHILQLLRNRNFKGRNTIPISVILIQGNDITLHGKGVLRVIITQLILYNRPFTYFRKVNNVISKFNYKLHRRHSIVIVPP